METVPRTLCLSSATTYMKNHRFPQVQYGTTVVHIQERLQGYRQLYACAVSTQLFHTLGSADLQIQHPMPPEQRPLQLVDDPEDADTRTYKAFSHGRVSKTSSTSLQYGLPSTGAYWCGE